MDFSKVSPDAYTLALAVAANQLPKRYQLPRGFVPWKQFARQQKAVAIKFTESLRSGDSIHKDLAEALLRTKPVAPSREYLPLPAFYLMLPEGLIPTQEGRWIRSVAVMDRRTFASYVPPEFLGVSEQGESLDAITLLAEDGRHYFNSGVRYGVKPESITEKDLDSFNSNSEVEVSLDLLAPVTVVERLVCQVLCAMTHCPELTDPHEVRAEQSVLQEPQAYRRPIKAVQIGRKYRSRVKGHEHSEASGRLVSPHWVSGHFHTLRCGPGRSQRILKWIEPYYKPGKLRQT